MDIIFKPTDVCSRYIKIEIEDNKDRENSILKEVSFMGGCPGNAIGLANSIKGKTVKEIIGLLKGIKCGARDTSCPDQLSKALEEYLNK